MTSINPVNYSPFYVNNTNKKPRHIQNNVYNNTGAAKSSIKMVQGKTESIIKGVQELSNAAKNIFGCKPKANNNNSNIVYCNRDYSHYPKGTRLLRGTDYKLSQGTVLQIGSKGYNLDLDKLNLASGETAIIGRGMGIDASIDEDDSISRNHLKIRATDSGYIVRDLNSLNGTSIKYSPLVLLHSDGTVTAHKNISGEAFNMLFGTVNGAVRSNSAQQSNGDCYLLTAINALYENPTARNTILNCFKETSDGRIFIRLPNGTTVFDYSRVMSEISKNPDQYSRTTPGLQALEYVYGQERFAKAQKLEAEGLKRNASEYTQIIYNILNYDKQYGYKYKNPIDFREGGQVSEVMSMFGYESAKYSDNDSIIEQLEDVNNWKNRVYTISTQKTPDGDGDDKYWNEELDIVGNHAYMLKPKMLKNGQTVFELRNPWHSNEISCNLTSNAIAALGCFSYLTVTKVK